VVEGWFAARGYAVARDSFDLGDLGGDGATGRFDAASAPHIWQCDGRASLVSIP
jgi:hypothetical protein